MHDCAVLVARHLDLEVAGPQHQPLQQQRRVAERRLRLAPGQVQRGRQLGHVEHAAHALAAAAGRRLHHDREADLGCAASVSRAVDWSSPL